MILLGIDCGTQSLKLVGWDPEKHLIKSASRSYGLIEGLPPGHKEQDPKHWIDALEGCLVELREKGIRMDAVRGIGISGQQHGLVALDSSDQVIRPVKLWNDTSSEAQCHQILEAAGGLESYRSEIGNSLPPGFTASKILWLRQNEPQAYLKMRHVLLPHDYLNWHLTGEMVTEAGDASGTGYFRVRERCWSEKALGWIDSQRGLLDYLPQVIGGPDAAGRLRRNLSAKWGMSHDVTVSSGGGDNMMGAIGSGNVEEGLVTLSLGTSGTLYSYSSVPIVDPEGEIAAFCDSTGGWLPLGCTMNVTVATEMIRGSLLPVGHRQYDRAIERIPAGADGMILLPYLEGERMPPVASGTGVLLGLRQKTASPAHLARAAMEGVTMGQRYGLTRMRQLGILPTEVRLIGGGARSPVWRQMVADIFDVSVVCPRNEEGPAFGAALQALWCTSRNDIRDLAREHVVLNEKTRRHPIESRSVIYNQLYDVYEQLSRTLIGSDVFSLHREFIQLEKPG